MSFDLKTNSYIVCSTPNIEATFSTAHGYALLLVVPASGPISTFAALILGCGSRFGSQDHAYYCLDYANLIILIELVFASLESVPASRALRFTHSNICRASALCIMKRLIEAVPAFVEEDAGGGR